MGHRVSPTLSTVQARLLTATVEPAIAALRFPPFFHFFSTTRAGGQKVRRRQTKWLGGDLGPPFGRPEPPGSQFLVWFSLGRLTPRPGRGAAAAVAYAAGGGQHHPPCGMRPAGRLLPQRIIHAEQAPARVSIPLSRPLQSSYGPAVEQPTRLPTGAWGCCHTQLHLPFVCWFDPAPQTRSISSSVRVLQEFRVTPRTQLRLLLHP